MLSNSLSLGTIGISLLLGWNRILQDFWVENRGLVDRRDRGFSIDSATVHQSPNLERTVGIFHLQNIDRTQNLA